MCHKQLGIINNKDLGNGFRIIPKPFFFVNRCFCFMPVLNKIDPNNYIYFDLVAYRKLARQKDLARQIIRHIIGLFN